MDRVEQHNKDKDRDDNWSKIISIKINLYFFFHKFNIKCLKHHSSIKPKLSIVLQDPQQKSSTRNCFLFHFPIQCQFYRYPILQAVLECWLITKSDDPIKIKKKMIIKVLRKLSHLWWGKTNSFEFCGFPDHIWRNIFKELYWRLGLLRRFYFIGSYF